MSKTITRIKKIKRPVVRPCPCAAGQVSCNYVVISHILGCPYDCRYCFLHTFYGKDEIVVYDNDEDILAQVSACMAAAERPLRIGTGQFSDSLALPEAAALGAKLVKLFAGQNDHLFELKTKSALVDRLLDLDHRGRTVIAWSVNPQKIVESDELGSTSLKDRMAAAEKCVEAGYPVGFHFDPIIHYPGWDKDYQEVVDLIFDRIRSEHIAWISLGALRYRPGLKLRMGELEVGEDGKMRYSRPLRTEIFRRMHGFIRARSKEACVYLCMESAGVWQGAGIENPQKNPYFRYFHFFNK